MSFKQILKKLEKEAIPVSNILDNVSNNIKELETSLISWKTNIPFEMILSKEDLKMDISREKKYEEIYKEKTSIFQSFKVFWIKKIIILSWEPCNISKKYNLFFIIKNEFWGWNEEENEYNVQTNVDDDEILFKKYFIETKLDIRLRYSKYLIPFMNGFIKELKKYKDKITINDPE